MLPLPAGRDASSSAGASLYERHRPQRTRLYQLVKAYYPALEAHLAARGPPLPGYVERATLLVEFGDTILISRGNSKTQYLFRTHRPMVD